MADDTTAPFRYRNPDGQGSVVCGWTKQGQLFVRPDMGWSGAVVVARDKAWELAKYLALGSRRRFHQDYFGRA